MSHAPILAPVTHYENFPVASILCPAHLRPAVAAIYHFARTADDLADEGDASPASRLADLSDFQGDLLAAANDKPFSPRWAAVFRPLQHMLGQYQLPLSLLTDLLDAFEQDVIYHAQQRRYANDDALLDYCRRSANPIGRLLLHLHGVQDATSLAQSDAICSALQLINFWQDVSVDAARGRWYITQQAMARFGVTQADFLPTSHSENAALLIAASASAARALMLKGAALPRKVPGRAGWELRLVVQGGLRILDKIEALGFVTWRTRPKLSAWDVPVLLWRALWMK
ncbi:squalene synthase HpnC [Rhodoferax antarcticus]|uniref:Squalene synthase n=1 Tax=Rhodoferax antarcticus ANT.BR TaxID=1111071 RepID=A0A1Q8YEA1_9BURK|nr:squalene synthase HpnC [Rhodoferax antarcticus]APW46176.1 squalene synthase HpnC [Rhodoferax antarcticus]MCW2313946.1 squalene synthase HpnC [Rhodoferax antarcticus]OLP06368.1 squalene synthase [Rhodoferax antarcticus ANT.BR]